jgi:hypothetical protein
MTQLLSLILEVDLLPDFDFLFRLSLVDFVPVPWRWWCRFPLLLRFKG